MALKKFLYFFILFFISTLLFAQSDQEKIYELSEVVKTATRTSTSTLELANSISVIDSSEIVNKRKLTVPDLLRSEYGVSLTEQGGPGKFTSVYMRGGNPGHTLVLLDGIELNMPNDPGSTVDFAHIPADNIERIEILRGPQSTLYGSDALAGVINIITKKGEGRTKLSLSAEGGSYNSFKGLAGINGSYNNFNYSASFSKQGTDGFSSAGEKYGNNERDGHSSINFSSRLGLDLNNIADINLIIRHTQSETDYDQWGGMFGDDPTYLFDLEETAFRLESEFNLFDGFWKPTAGVSYLKNVRHYNYDSTLNNPYFSNSFYDGNKLKIDLLNNFYLQDNYLLTLGLETEEEKAYTEYFSFSSTSNFTSILPNNSLRTSAVFLQGQLNLDKIFFSTLGLRYDNHEKFGSSITYRFSPAVMIWETGTKLRGTIGTGFKAPSIFYLFDPAFGNENLSPEESFGWDLGFEQYILQNNLTAGFTYFYNEYKDLFGTDENFRTININKAVTNGIEVFITYKEFDLFNVDLNYTFTDAKDKSVNSPDKDLQLIRRPRDKFSASISSDFSDQVNLNIEVIYAGKRFDKDFSKFPAERVELKPYTLINMAATYHLFQYLSLYGRIQNILNEDYEEVFGYATPEASFYGGVSIRL